jgi:hypothetical protein
MLDREHVRTNLGVLLEVLRDRMAGLFSMSIPKHLRCASSASLMIQPAASIPYALIQHPRVRRMTKWFIMFVDASIEIKIQVLQTVRKIFV